MNILVFLPTYNEKDNIGNIIDAVNSLNFKKEILIVDDNSKDGTLEIINDKRKQLQNLTLIVRKGKKGRGLAGVAAFKYFIKSNNDILIEMDADFSHNPIYIPTFLKFFPKYDLVIGSRFIGQAGEKGRSMSRTIISILANIIVRILFQTKIKDCTSGFRAFKKELVQNFNLDNFFSVHYSITEEILYACILSRAKVKEVPIVFLERASGESKLNFKKIFYTFAGIFKIRLRGNKILRK